MRVELVGLPSCGKSTAINKIIEMKKSINNEIVFPINEFTTSKNKIISLVKKILITFKIVIKNPKKSIYIYRYIYKYIKNKKNSIRFYLYFITVIDKISSKTSRAVEIYDEGIIQVLLGLNLISKDSKGISEFKLLPELLPNKLIFIDIDFESFLIRIKEREKKIKSRDGIKIEEKNFSNEELFQIYNKYNILKCEIMNLCNKNEIEYIILNGKDIDTNEIIKMVMKF